MSPTLLPVLIDRIAEEEPDALFAEYPVSGSDCKRGFNTISYAQLANAINGVAQHLLSVIGPGRNYETLAYLGPNDARYVFVFVAAIKAGYKIFLTSPRNSSAAHASLFAELKCEKILTTDPAPPSLQNVLVETDVQVLHIAPLAELLSTTYEPVPYQKTFDTAKDDEVWSCHTSGTTGLPKARVYTNDFNAQIMNNVNLPPPSGSVSLFGTLSHNKVLFLLPFFHPAGVLAGILNAVCLRDIIVLAPPAAPPSVEGMLEILDHTTADWAIMAPATLEALAKNESQLNQAASKLSMIVFAGGSLPQPLGDIIASKIRLCSQLGSSETGPFPQIYPEGFNFVRDWNYLSIQPAAGIEFEPQPDGTYELVVKRSQVAAQFQPVFRMFPELDEYRTRDIFTPHPTLPDVWIHASRSDDVIVFLNGEKTNPITFEAQVSQHPDVATALVFGKQRWEAGILIELKDKRYLDVTERARMIEKLWPTIQQANHDAPAHARICPSHVLFVEPDMPLQRTSKDTVRRQVSFEQYRAKIDRLYADADEMKPATFDMKDNIDLDDFSSIVRVIQEEFQKIASSTEPFDPDTYFFSRGIDSLQIIRVVRQLRQRLSTGLIQPNVVYAHPTASSLAEVIRRLHRNEQSDHADEDESRRKNIKYYIEHHISMLNRRLENWKSYDANEAASDASPAGQVAILTGSTGNVGSYVLRSLILRSSISHIYCLNRSPESELKQKLRNVDTDPSLPLDFDRARITFLEANLSKSNLGLSEQQYQILLRDSTVIIHNAWPVDFNLPLKSFDSHLEGVGRLCELTAIGAHHPKLIFVSSISAVLDSALKSASTSEAFSEAVPDDSLSPSPAGYAESKYIAERILDHAATVHNPPVKIARVGQVSSPVNSSGVWKRDEWFPNLILNSRSMSCLPSTLGSFEGTTEDIDWIPIDVLADTLVDLGLDSSQGSIPSQAEHVFQIVNPHRTAWSELAPGVQEVLPNIRIISNEEWLDSLRKVRDTVQQSSTNDENEGGLDQILADNPALKLYDFYQTRLRETRVARWSTINTERASKSFATARAINKEDVKRWVTQMCQGYAVASEEVAAAS